MIEIFKIMIDVKNDITNGSNFKLIMGVEIVKEKPRIEDNFEVGFALKDYTKIVKKSISVKES